MVGTFCRRLVEEAPHGHTGRLHFLEVHPSLPAEQARLGLSDRSDGAVMAVLGLFSDNLYLHSGLLRLLGCPVCIGLDRLAVGGIGAAGVHYET